MTFDPSIPLAAQHDGYSTPGMFSQEHRSSSAPAPDPGFWNLLGGAVLVYWPAFQMSAVGLQCKVRRRSSAAKGWLSSITRGWVGVRVLGNIITSTKGKFGDAKRLGNYCKE